jgi:hypothetical protein
MRDSQKTPSFVFTVVDIKRGEMELVLEGSSDGGERKDVGGGRKRTVNICD